MTLWNRISSLWRKKKELQLQPDFWQLDSTPTPFEEAIAFKTGQYDADGHKKYLVNEDFSNDIKEKKRFAAFAYTTSAFWLALLIIWVTLDGLKINPWAGNKFLELLISFEISEAKFIAVVTTTTTAIIGLALVIGQYLFNRRN